MTRWRRESVTAMLSAAMADSVALGFHVLWRGETDTAKQVGELMGVWHPHGSDSLTCGGSAGVRPPLGALGQAVVGHSA